MDNALTQARAGAQNLLNKGGQAVQSFFQPKQVNVPPPTTPIQNFLSGAGQTLNNFSKVAQTFGPMAYGALENKFNQQNPITGPIATQTARSLGNTAYNLPGALYRLSGTPQALSVMQNKPLPQYGLSQALGDVGTGVKAAGAVALGPETQVAGGLINSGINTLKNVVGKKPLLQNNAQAFRQGLEFTQLAGPIGKGVESIPLVEQFGRSLSKIPGLSQLAETSSKAEGIIKGIGGGVAKQFGTGLGYGALTGQNPLSTAVDFAKYGVAEGIPGMNSVSESNFSMKPETRDVLVQQEAVLKNPEGYVDQKYYATSGEREQAIKDAVATAKKTVYAIADKYLPNSAADRAGADPFKIIKALTDLDAKNRLGNTMNLVGDETKAPLKATDIPTQLADQAQAVAKGVPINKEPVSYVDNSPLKFNLSDNTKANAQDIRSEYSGAKNAQIVRTNNLADQVQKLVPDQAQREGLTLLRDVGGDQTKLQAALQDPKFAPYVKQIQAALNPTAEMTQANGLLDQYYNQTGQAGQQHGFLNELRDNYVNRIYNPEPPKTNVQTEAGRTGLSQSTSHAKGRVFDTLLDAISNGKTPATLDSSDLLKIHGSEFAKTLTNNKLFEGLQQANLGQNFEGGKLPAGYQRIGNSNFGVPDYLATGLKAITDPNFINKVDELKGIKKYQGFVKTIDLSVSLFHHFTLGMQALYQTKFGTELPQFAKFAKDADYGKVAEDNARYGLMTQNIDANKEVLSRLNKGNDFFSKLMNIPGFKQYGDVIKANNEVLFGKIQPWLKNMDMGMKVSKWVGDHPGATDGEVVAAKRGFAREVNSAYGGLNWEALGKTPSFQGVMRLGLLAPDWTYSNIDLAKQAFGGGTSGSAARSHLASALIGGALATEALSKLITGHYTNQNAKGHEMEVEVRPGVYISLFRGGIGDFLKLASNIRENGVAQGAMRFAQGKLSPIARTGVMLASGVDHNGNQLAPAGASPQEKDLRYAGAVAQNLGPVPFGVTNVAKMAKKAVTDPASYGLVASGLARYGAPSTPDQLNKEAYFKARDQELTKLTPKEQNLVQGIPAQDPNDPVAKQTKYSILKSNPNVLAYFRNIAFAQANGNTAKVDPLYTAPAATAQAYATWEAQNPGSQDKKDFVKAHPEVIQLSQARSAYFQANPVPGATNTSAAPQPGAYVQQQMNNKNWKDPQVQAYLNANTAYNNQLRSQLGLTPTGSSFGSGGGAKRLRLSRPKPGTPHISVKKFKTPKAKLTQIRVPRLKSKKTKLSKYKL